MLLVNQFEELYTGGEAVAAHAGRRPPPDGTHASMPFGARLEPLYRMAFHYPQGWNVALAGEGTEGRHLFLTEGRREPV